MITGTGPFASAGVVSVSWMSTVIGGYAELSTWPTSFFVIDRHVADLLLRGGGHLPLHLGRVLRDPAVDLAVEVLDDLRPPLRPPHPPPS